MATPNALAQKQARALAALEARQERMEQRLVSLEQKLDALLGALEAPAGKRAPAKKGEADGSA